jgi:hypothetical protein
MDELALLKQFRLEDAVVPSEAREYARAAFRHARSTWTRRRVVTLALVAAALLAGSAYAVGRVLHVGDPAPPEFVANFARFAHPEPIPVPDPSDPQLKQARVEAVLESSVGRAYLFGAPNATGVCALTWIEGDRGYQGRLNMPSECGPSAQSTYAFSNRPLRGRIVRFFWGHAGNGVARIALRFGNRTVTVPMHNRWFFAEFSAQPDDFLAYNATGRLVNRRAFQWTRPTRVFRPPHQVTHARQVARIHARHGTEQITLFVARASDGGNCQIVRSDRTPSNRGCSVAKPAARKIAVSGMYFGGLPGGVLLLVGPVGTDIAKLELRYQNHHTASIPLHDGWALYEVTPNHYANGQRPEMLVGRDTRGNIVATKGFPW